MRAQRLVRTLAPAAASAPAARSRTSSSSRGDRRQRDVLADDHRQPAQLHVGRVAQLDLAGVGVDPVGAGDRPQHRHQVLGPARDRAHRQHARGLADGLGPLAAVGHQVRGALVAEHAVEERGQPDRAADVASPGRSARRRCPPPRPRRRTSRPPCAAGRRRCWCARRRGSPTRSTCVSSEVFVTPSGIAPRSSSRAVVGADSVASVPLRATTPGGVGHALEPDRLLDRARHAQVAAAAPRRRRRGDPRASAASASARAAS